MPEDNKDTIADPKTIGEIESKMRLEGVVKSTEIFGVLVDVGVDHDGLLHISEIKKYNDGVDKQDLDVGQKITVWVKKTDEGAGQIWFYREVNGVISIRIPIESNLRLDTENEGKQNSIIVNDGESVLIIIKQSG